MAYSLFSGPGMMHFGSRPEFVFRVIFTVFVTLINLRLHLLLFSLYSTFALNRKLERQILKMEGCKYVHEQVYRITFNIERDHMLSSLSADLPGTPTTMRFVSIVMQSSFLFATFHPDLITRVP